MKIIYSVISCLLLLSCNKKEIFVPQADVSLETEITDFTSVSMLYDLNTNSEITIDVKDKTLITQTRWIFEVDKRLPLKLVIPEVIKLQNKKSKKAEAIVLDNYYTYMDTINKAVAYMPFKLVSYEKSNSNLEQNADRIDLKVNREGKVVLNNKLITIQDFIKYINTEYSDKVATIYLAFDENLLFEHYIQIKLNLYKITLPNIKISTIEVVY